jgi:hypothetical protein
MEEITLPKPEKGYKYELVEIVKTQTDMLNEEKENLLIQMGKKPPTDQEILADAKLWHPFYQFSVRLEQINAELEVLNPNINGKEK